MRLFCLLALAAAVFVFVDEVLRAQNVLADWHAYFRAATAILRQSDLYAEAKTLLERNSYDFWIETDGQYVYPPLLALLVTPIAAATNIGRGGDVWLLLLTCAIVGALLVVLVAGRRPVSIETLAVVAVPVLTSVPVLLSIRYGQVDLPLLLVTLLALLAFVRGRPIWAGVALGLAIAVKPTLALYGLFFLRKRQWTSLVVAGVTALALGLGPFLFLRNAQLTDWLAVARYFGTGDYAAYPSNQSVRGLLLRAFVGGPRHEPLTQSDLLAFTLWGLIAAAAVLGWWAVVSSQLASGMTTVTEFALTGSLVLLISPLSEDIHYVALAPALAVLADRIVWGSASVPRWWVGLAFASCFYFMQPWLDFAYNRGGGRLSRLFYSGSFVYGLVVVAGTLAILLYLDRRARPLPVATVRPTSATARLDDGQTEAVR
jgi:hypothetical protein